MTTNQLISRAGIASSAALFLPMFASAAKSLKDIVTGTVLPGLNAVVPILITLAVIFFLWGLANYILKAGEEKQKAIGTMIWGIVAIAVMVSIWGLVGILQSTFGISGNENALVPNTDFQVQ